MIQLDWVGDLNDLNILSIFVRLLLAMAFGGTIGFERGIRQRAAGLRTHMLLAVGAASTMLVSQYMYASYGVGDPARLSAQVISGIGFLGAGTIIVTRRNQVKGLTTAAGLWTTSAVGLALGAGMYIIGITGTLLIVLEQFLMHRFHFGNDAYTMQEIKVRFRDSLEFRDYLFRLLQERGGSICNCAVNKTGDGDVAYTLTVRVKEPISAQELQGLMDRHEQISSFSV